MNQKLLAVAIATAMTIPVAANAASADVSGFVDTILTFVDESADSAVPGGNNTAEGKFQTSGEVDFTAGNDMVSVRVDVDLGETVGMSDSYNIEQAFFAWKAHDMVTILGGVFNNPIGQDAEDAPDMMFTSHSAVYNVLDGQTSNLDGNNLAGIAAAFAAGPVNVTVAALNELADSDEENSFALALSGSPMQGLDVEFGYVTQADQADSANPLPAENWWDLNAAWSGSGFMAGFDYLAADEVVDAAWNVWGGYDFGNGFAVKARYDMVELDSAVGPTADQDINATTLYASYQIAQNLSAALEFKDQTDDTGGLGAAVGINDGSLVTLEFIATLP